MRDERENITPESIARDMEKLDKSLAAHGGRKLYKTEGTFFGVPCVFHHADKDSLEGADIVAIGNTRRERRARQAVIKKAVAMAGKKKIPNAVAARDDLQAPPELD